MRIQSAQVTNYRCIVDSENFTVEDDKTILVGINESGKTGLLRALQQVSPPAGTPQMDWLYDAPAPLIDQVRRGYLNTASMAVATIIFKPSIEDLASLSLPVGSNDIRLETTVYLDNSRDSRVLGLPKWPTIGDSEKSVARLVGAMQKQANAEAKAAAQALLLWKDSLSADDELQGSTLQQLKAHLDATYPLFAEGSAADGYWNDLKALHDSANGLNGVKRHLVDRRPPLVYYSSYFSVRPKIHLNRLAEREESGELDLNYDFGNLQLLKFLGFSARELSDMASSEPEKPQDYATNVQSQEAYRTELEQHERRVTERKRALQSASARLTSEIRKVWNDPSISIELDVDGQYLQTLVKDELGIPVELDQRSEGFRWLVSFYVVFYAQASENLKDAVLLLDEPGLSLHALKQQEFRKTVSRLSAGNQIIYTTHSPFMVGSDELDLVRVVEMTDRTKGTKVHTRLAVDDPRSIYPLQAALGYDLAQSMFTHKRNLVVEGITDLLYIETLNNAFGAEGGPVIEDGVAIVPAGSASKVIYYSTVLTSQDLDVAALLDSDAAGDLAAEQEDLWQLLSTKRILRSGDYLEPTVKRAEIEDMFRITLSMIARDEFGWDSSSTIAAQSDRPVMEILQAEHAGVSKWKLARAFVKWLSTNGTAALDLQESASWAKLAAAVNKALA